MCEKPRQLTDPNSPVLGATPSGTPSEPEPALDPRHPNIANQWVKALLEQYETGGWLPKVPPGVEYSGIMEASHEIRLIVAVPEGIIYLAITT